MGNKTITILNTENEDEDLAHLDAVIAGIQDGMRERGEPIPDDGFNYDYNTESLIPPATAAPPEAPPA